MASANASGTEKLLYVCNGGAGNISVIDLGTNAEVASIDRPSMPYSTTLSPDGSRLYVTYSAGITRKIIVIDANTYTVISDSVAVKNPFLEYMALSPDGSQLYVSDGNFVDGHVTAINTTDFNESSTIMAGYSHGGMAVLRR